MILLILIFIYLCYFALVVSLIRGWQRAMIERPENDYAEEVMISVLVPVRNEENSIQYLLRDLKSQHYKSFEVIVIDDHSNDKTNEIVAVEIESDDRFKSISNSGHGKKMALSSGIKEARGPVIITTDADCRVGVDWLKTIAVSFNDEDVKLVFGGVRINGRSFFARCQTLEFYGLIGAGVATLAFGFPSMCNGANLAFRKVVYEETGGYADNYHLPSGDDEFLLRKVFRKYPRGIRFINDTRSIVSTNPQHTWRDFVNQRIRWAGKWRYHNTLFSKLLALFIFIFQSSSILAVYLSVVGLLSVTVTLVLWGIKIFLEYIYIRKISLFFGGSLYPLPFLLLQLVYPIYVIGIGLISNFMSFEWKGRRLKSIQANSISDYRI